MDNNLCKLALLNNGDIHPLIIFTKETNGTGLMNPSIFIDNDRLLVNLRHVNYTLYHSNGSQVFNNRYGPLSYIHPENDNKLRTINYICELDSALSVKRFNKVDTSKNDIQPVWDFIGLEDARLVKWNNKFYICGVRRDVKPNGEGRMELSEIEISDDYFIEINRYNISPPNNPNSYCEKNWMPVLDMPFHFVKWTNPTEVVKVNIDDRTSETIYLSHESIPSMPDLRGSSHVIDYKDYRICIIHDVNLFKNRLSQKDGKYMHRFIIWDKQWNIIKISDPFTFMDGEIEFCCGMSLYKDDLLISFGFQDNSAYLLRLPVHVFESFINLKKINKANKFNNFPPVYYISYIMSLDRRNKLEESFMKYKITDFQSIISTKESDDSNIIIGKYLDQIDKGVTNCTVSHLKAIKEWYSKSNSEYGLFFEDDIDLSISNYWNFTWDEFMNNLPGDWDCIQLTCIRKDHYNLKIRKRLWDDWSVTAYLLKRKYAKKIIENYCDSDKFTLEIKNGNILPLPENIIYGLGNTYTLPLFVENISFKSTFINRNVKEDHEQVHIDSSTYINDWWIKNGKEINIKNLMKL